jgi:ATP-binding cassette, subfamily G (WHITE), member 1
MSIIFCSGLDSSSSTYTIRLLHELSREGRTIVCTIHQPSATIYELFDHVYVLAEGHCVYQGAHNNTLPFLSSLGLNCPQYHSASDYLLEVSNGEYGNFTYLLAKAAMTEQWRSSNSLVYIRDGDEFDDRSERIIDDVISQNTDEKRISLYTKTSDGLSSKISFNSRSTMRSTPSELTRLFILVSRMNVLLFRDWTVTHLKLFLHILCGILIGLFFGDSGINAHKSISNIGFFLANIVYLWYTTMMPGILRFPNEINIVRKEVFNNWYRLRTFYFASLITSTPIHVSCFRDNS